MLLLKSDIYRRLRRRYGRRRFHAYSIAAGKSGTHSLADMFSHYYRAAHEPAASELIPILQQRLNGTLSSEALEAWLVERDRRLNLEMDSSGLNSIAAAELVRAFPNARFIVTVRDCFSWANSWFNQILNNPEPSPHWQQWRETLHGTRESCTYDAAEEPLRAAGTWSLDRVFQGWVAMYESGVAAAPADRTLRLYTHRLSEDVERLAAFLGIPSSTIRTDRSHTYQSTVDRGLLYELDAAFVNARAQAICGPLMRDFYPGLPCELGTGYRLPARTM